MHASPRRTLCKGLDLAAKTSGAQHPVVVVVKEHAPAFANSEAAFTWGETCATNLTFRSPCRMRFSCRNIMAMTISCRIEKEKQAQSVSIVRLIDCGALHSMIVIALPQSYHHNWSSSCTHGHALPLLTHIQKQSCHLTELKIECWGLQGLTGIAAQQRRSTGPLECAARHP